MNERIDITDLIDPWTVQCPWMTQAEIMDHLDAQVTAGVARWFWSKDGQTCWLVRHCSTVVAEVHLFSRSSKLVQNCREIQSAVWADTSYKKLEMRTHLPGVAALAHRIGWVDEGLRMASFLAPNGNLYNEFLYGVTR